MIRRAAFVVAISGSMLAAGASAALACGGLVAPGHAEVLQRSTALAAWHDGLEHYVTGFRFAGSARTFGYIVPLPGVPTRIQRGGDWTLERLEREVRPPVFEALKASAADAAPAPVQVLQRTTIEALDITVVRGGGAAVAAWASRNGFPLTPDAPRILRSYDGRGGVFALAKFDRTSAASRGLVEGQGQTIQFTIPTPGPWIPLRILALGKVRLEPVDATLFLLTDSKPSIVPGIDEMPGMSVTRSGWASPLLLHDLRTDRGMAWVPRNLWFTALELHAPASLMRSDLAADGARSFAAPAGPLDARTRVDATPWWELAVAASMVLVLIASVSWLLRPRRGLSSPPWPAATA